MYISPRRQFATSRSVKLVTIKDVQTPYSPECQAHEPTGIKKRHPVEPCLYLGIEWAALETPPYPLGFLGGLSR